MRLSVKPATMIMRVGQHCSNDQAEMRLRGSHAHSPGGFTLVELITIMVIVGILAVAAVPRFFDRSIFDSRGFYDQTISTLRYAQKTAVAQHRFVCVAFAADSITLTYDPLSPSATHTAANCTNNLTGPAGQTPYTVKAPSGVTFIAPSAGTFFSFDALGRPNATPAITVGGYTITVEAATGYVH